MKALATMPSRACVSTRARTRSERERIPTRDFPFATGIARKPVLIIFSAASVNVVSGVSSGGTWRTFETFVAGGRFLRRMSSRSVTTPMSFFRSRTGSSWMSWDFIFPRASPIVSSGATVTRSVVMKSETRRSWTMFRFTETRPGEVTIAEVRIRKFFPKASIRDPWKPVRSRSSGVASKASTSGRIAQRKPNRSGFTATFATCPTEVSRPSSRAIVPGSRCASSGTRRPSPTRGSRQSRSVGMNLRETFAAFTSGVESGTGLMVRQRNAVAWTPSPNLGTGKGSPAWCSRRASCCLQPLWNSLSGHRGPWAAGPFRRFHLHHELLFHDRRVRSCLRRLCPDDSASGSKLDPVGPFRDLLVDCVKRLVREQSGSEPRAGLLRDGRGPQDGARPSWVVNVIRFHKEPGLSLQSLGDKDLLGQDGGHDSMVFLRPGEGSRVVLDHMVGGKTRLRCDAREFRERRRSRVLRVQHDSAAEFLRTLHGISKQEVTIGEHIHRRREVRTPDFPECDGLPVGDETGGPVDSRSDDVHGCVAAERLPQRKEFDRIGSQGDEDLEACRSPDGIRHRERLVVRLLVVLRVADRDVVVGGMGQQDRGPARSLEDLGRLDAPEFRTQVDVVVEDRHPPRNGGGPLGFRGNHGAQVHGNRARRLAPWSQAKEFGLDGGPSSANEEALPPSALA